MKQLASLAYIVAAIQFVRADNVAGVVLSLILLAWLMVVGSFISRTAVPEPSSATDGWGNGESRESAATLAGLQHLGFLSSFMATGLMLFGPLLMVWAFL